MNTLHVGHIYYMGWHVLLLKEVKKNNGLLEYKAKTKRREVVVVLRTSCVIINYSSPQTSRGIYCWV